jgi:hypothetical protein
MPETLAVDRPPAPKAAATVSASALALHLDCSRAYIGKLEDEGVIQRQGAGFPLDRAALPISDTYGASGGNRRAVRLMLNMQKQRRRCFASASPRSSAS